MPPSGGGNSYVGDAGPPGSGGTISGAGGQGGASAGQGGTAGQPSPGGQVNTGGNPGPMAGTTGPGGAMGAGGGPANGGAAGAGGAGGAGGEAGGPAPGGSMGAGGEGGSLPPTECAPGGLRGCPDCDEGFQECVNGEWGPCVPPAESCDGWDNDCDGETDEGFGTGQECFAGEGECIAFGEIVCDEFGEVYCDAIPGEPDLEACNDLDDDCDGAFDEGYDLGRVCDTGRGRCAVEGEVSCVGRFESACVSPIEIQPEREQCNAFDDDCDGRTDEDFDIGAACEVGIGECRTSGISECDFDGGVTCTARVSEPENEVCNGLDDDCDGLADEDFDLRAPCQVGIGQCLQNGETQCSEDGGVVCDGIPGDPADEACNNVDDDCDGATDEGACENQQPNFGEIRLVNGEGPNEGRVELYADPNWLPFCLDTWDANETRLVCEELGFGPPAAPAGVAAFEEAELLVDMTCRENRPPVNQCDLRVADGCDEAVFVRCTPRDALPEPDCDFPIPFERADQRGGTFTFEALIGQGDTSGTCFVDGGPEAMVVLTLDERANVAISTSIDGRPVNTSIYVRTACEDPDSELSCRRGDVDGPLTVQALEPGTYYVIAEYPGGGDARFDVTLQVNSDITECNDGLDNDRDGRIDLFDLGCSSDADASEVDPDNVPECGDRRDNDGDGFTDYPDDPQCMAAGGPSEQASCMFTDNLLVIPPNGGNIQYNTVNQPSVGRGSCGGGGPQQVAAFTLMQRAEVEFRIIERTYDTLIHLRTNCDDANSEIACNDDFEDLASRILRELVPGTYYLFLDGFAGRAGSGTLRVTVNPQ